MPALQSYATLPYGNWVLHKVVILAGHSYPSGCLVAMFSRRCSVTLVSILTIVGSAAAIFIAYCAIMSPMPPLVSTPLIGGYLSITFWILYTLILSYVKTIVTLAINEAKGEEGLFWVGMFTQIGAFIGAVIMYLLVNWFKLFKDEYY